MLGSRLVWVGWRYGSNSDVCLKRNGKAGGGCKESEIKMAITG